MPNVSHPFPIFCSGLRIFTTRWETVRNEPVSSVMVSHNYAFIHPHNRAASLRLVITAKPAGVLKIHILGCIVQHHLFDSWWKIEGYLYCSTSCQHTWIMQKSGCNLAPGAICTIWWLFVVLDPYMPVGPCSQLLSILKKPLVKSTLPWTFCIWRNHEMASPREWTQCNLPPTQWVKN